MLRHAGIDYHINVDMSAGIMTLILQPSLLLSQVTIVEFIPLALF